MMGAATVHLSELCETGNWQRNEKWWKNDGPSFNFLVTNLVHDDKLIISLRHLSFRSTSTIIGSGSTTRRKEPRWRCCKRSRLLADATGFHPKGNSRFQATAVPFSWGERLTLVGGWKPPTHLKNMLVKLEIWWKIGVKIQNIWWKTQHKTHMNFVHPGNRRKNLARSFSQLWDTLAKMSASLPSLPFFAGKKSPAKERFF